MLACFNLTEANLMAGAIGAEGSAMAWAHLALSVGALVVSLLNLAVLTKPRMLKISSVNYLLSALEVGNLLFALLHLPIFMARFFWPHFLVSEPYQIMYVILIHVIWADLLYIIWMTVLVGAWRYVLVSRPLQSRYMLSKSRALIWTCVVLGSCLLMATLQFFGFQFQFIIPHLCSIPTWSDFYGAVWNSWSLEARCAWGHFYLILGLIIYVGPMFFFLIINALIIQELYQVQITRQGLQGESFLRGYETRTTIVIILLMWIFLVGYAPASLSVAVQLFWTHQWSVPLPWEEQFWEFLPSLIVGISSLFGYYFMNNVYKEVFWDVLACGRKSSARKDNVQDVS